MSIGMPLVEISKKGDLLAYLHPGPIRNERTTTTVVDARTGKTVRVLRSASDPPRDAAFSPDGRMLATAHYGGEVAIWDLATGRALQRLRTVEVSWAVAFSPDGQTLYTAGDQGLLRAYDLGGKQRYLHWTQVAPARRYLHVLASGNGERIAYVWNEAGTSWVRIADRTTGRMTPPQRLGLELQQGQSHAPVSWRSDGQRLIVNDLNSFVVLDARTGAVVQRKAFRGLLSAAYVDRSGRIVVGNIDGTSYLDSDLRQTGRTADWYLDCCTAVSPDGKTAVLFSEGHDGATMVWRIVRAATGEVVREGGLPTWVNAAAYSPNGQLIAVTGTEGVYTIDTRSGAVKVAPSTSHRSEVVSVRFSPDGSRIVSGAADGTVTLWDAESLDGLLSVSAATPVPVAPIFTRGGDVLAIPSYDGKAYHWDTSTGHILGQACAMAGRNLTQAEWERSFAGRAYQKTCP
ncbi:WD40 repeat domain-containing protein [Kribbella sp. NPDC050124]|uniref:WD40 repeat domain-containing protein n=1 Tax=Kribbella sp. NPDC050124 TaxID=3364114 RepID=UPI00378ADB28